MNFIVLPLISIYGVFTNFFSVLVAISLNKNEIMNLVIMFNSVFNFIFCFLCAFFILIRCGSLCPYSYTQLSKTYELYIYLYICYSLLLANQLLESVLGVIRLLSFNAHKNCYLKITKNHFKLIGVTVLAISFILYGCNILSNRYVSKFGYLVEIQSSGFIQMNYLYKVEQRTLPDLLRYALFSLNVLENVALQLFIFSLDMTIFTKLIMFSRRKQIVITDQHIGMFFFYFNFYSKRIKL